MMKDSEADVRRRWSELERRWLSEARAEEPPPRWCAGFERALGIAPGAAVTPAAPRVEAAASAGKGASGTVVASLAALGVGGAIGLVLLLTRAAPPAAPDAKVTPESAAAVTAAQPAPGPSQGVSGEMHARHPRPALRDEIFPASTVRRGGSGHEIAGEALALCDRYRMRHPRAACCCPKRSPCASRRSIAVAAITNERARSPAHSSPSTRRARSPRAPRPPRGAATRVTPPGPPERYRLTGRRC